MRTTGDRYWLQRARRAALLSCALVSITTATATAAPVTRHAVPSGGATSGGCTEVAPCTLEQAIEGAASGDTVSMTPGSYTVDAPIAAADLTLTGADSEDTTITGAAGLAGPVLTLDQGATVKNLTITATGAQPALDLDGGADAVELHSTAGDAMVLRGGSTLENSVVHTSAANATALRIAAGLASNPLVRHATVVATGTGSTAIDAAGLVSLSTLSVRQSIANGVGSDVTGVLLTPGSVNLSYSAWRTANSSYYTSGSGNRDIAVSFPRAATLDFAPDIASPAVNSAQRGDSPSVSDLAGRPRDIGAAPDMGAYELPLPPAATTGTAAAISASSADVTATTNPRTVSTSYWVQYGDSAAFGATTPSQAAGAGATDVTSTVSLTGLLPGTTYYYRTVADNEWGRVNGATLTFATDTVAPSPAPDAPSSVTATSATLEGTVSRGGAQTDAFFEWGETAPAYGSSTGVEDLGTGPGAVAVTGVTVTGLVPNTEYHYRVVAENENGRVKSADRSFRTLVAAPGVTLTAPGGVTTEAATVRGDVDPGGDDTAWHFEYGVGAYDRMVAGGTVAGASAQTVTRTLSGLLPGTTYQYRLVAQNAAGTRATTGSFTTQVAAPRAETGDAIVAPRSATVGGQVNTGGGTGTWKVEYGTTRSYGRRSGPHNAPAASDDQDVMATITGLEPSTTYHYRFVAQNSAGTHAGADQTFRTAAGPPQSPADDPDDVTEPTGSVPAPQEPAPDQRQGDGLPAPDPTPPVGQSANAAPAGGTVRVRVPGSSGYVTLTAGAGIPIGSVVDATNGQVTITSAADAYGRTQTANFGGSEFKLLQKRAARPITDIVLTGPIGCTSRPLAKTFDADVFAAARRKWSRRRLWGNGHGRFRTRGRRAAATVRGTHWLTEDRCDGTLVRVKRGLVEVRDLVRRKTVMVPKGKQYLARSKGAAAKAKRARIRRR